MVQEEHLSVIVCTAYMNEAAMCDEVYVLNEGNILFNGTPEGLSQVAAGKCFEVNPPAGLPYRVLQGSLLDDKEEIIDAVPQSGTVRYIAAHPGTALPALERWNLVPKAVPPRWKTVHDPPPPGGQPGRKTDFPGAPGQSAF